MTNEENTVEPECSCTQFKCACFVAEIEARIAELEAKLAIEINSRENRDYAARKYRDDFIKSEARNKELGAELLGNEYTSGMVFARDARIKELEAELARKDSIFSDLLDSKLRQVSDHCDEINELRADLKAQAEECARMRAETYKDAAGFLDAMVIQDELFGGNSAAARNLMALAQDLLLLKAKEALSHPPTKSERLAKADSDLLEAANNLYPSEPEFDDARIDWVSVQVDRDGLKIFREAIARRAAILAEGETK